MNDKLTPATELEVADEILATSGRVIVQIDAEPDEFMPAVETAVELEPRPSLSEAEPTMPVEFSDAPRVTLDITEVPFDFTEFAEDALILNEPETPVTQPIPLHTKPKTRAARYEHLASGYAA